MEITIKRDGLTLRGVLEGTDQLENERVAVLFHGFQGNRGTHPGKLLYDLSHELNRRSLATLRFDFAGCGESDGTFDQMTVLGELLDAMAILDFVRTKVKAKQVLVAGHSQGGVVAAMVAAAYRDLVDRLLLLAPAVSLKSDALKGECQGTSYDPNHVPLTVLVNGIAVGGQYFRSAQLLPILETAAHYPGPALVMQGDADQVVSPKEAKELAAALPQGKLELLAGEDHSLEVDVAPALERATGFLLAE